MTSVLKKFTYNTAHGRPLVGDTKTSVLDFDHVGWLKCDGRSLNKNDYLFLWNVIGYSFGGSGNSFSLPAPAGRVVGILGEPDIATGTNHTMGQEIGAETHTLTVAEMPTHNHGVTDPGHTHTYLGVQSQNAASGVDTVAENSPRPTETTGSNTTGITINNAGSSNAHNNMQPTLYVGNFFIYCGKPHEGRTVLQTGMYF